MNAIDQLKSVLCDPRGKCCIAGSDEDRLIIDRALHALAQPEPMHPKIEKLYEDFFDKCFRESPPKREWVGLDENDKAYASRFSKVLAFQYIEAKLKEKNQ